MRRPVKETRGFESGTAAKGQRPGATLQWAGVAVTAALSVLLATSGCARRDGQADNPSRLAPRSSLTKDEPRARDPHPALAEQTADRIHARATLWFTNAFLYKPVPREPADLAWTLAPLIIQEASQARGSGSAFAQPNLQPPAVPVETHPSTVYFDSDAIPVRERFHPRFSYWWSGPNSSDSGLDSSKVQGVRLTLDSTGAPVIWEILTDPSGMDVVFVTQSLEQAAQKHFGAPLPGRRFSIEAAWSNAPTTVVARVIDDGPVPMGPIVYLSGDGRTISTLICRCMPAQASNLMAASFYQLVPQSLPRNGPSAGAIRPGYDAPLERRLRLPTDF
jgi:hypothetical protein